MNLFDRWRRTKLAWRIAGRGYDLGLRYDVPSQTEIQKTLLESYDLPMLTRIDSYQRHNSSYQPHLTGTIVRACRNGSSGESPEFHFEAIETLTGLLKQVEEEFSYPGSPNYEKAMGASEPILDEMLKFVLSTEDSEFSGGNGIRIIQFKHLLAAAFLLVQSGYPGIFEPVIYSNEGIPVTHHEEWLTLRILDDASDLTLLVTEYWKRAQRRESIGAKLSLDPDNVWDNMCDYSDETIDLLVETRENNADLYHAIVNKVIDYGAGEALVRENCYFAPKIDLAGRAASMFTTTLHCYTQLGEHEDYSLAPQRVRDQCMGLLSVAAALWGSGISSLKDSEVNSFMLVNRELIDFIIDRPHLASRIVSTITDRKIVDMEMLRAATSDVMSEGIL